MKQTTPLKLRCAAILFVLASYGCGDKEQQANDQTAPQPSANAPADGLADAAETPSLVSPGADSGSDISAIRLDDSAAEADTQQQSDEDDATAIRTQAEQYRKTKDADTRVQIVEEVGNINADDLMAVALFSEALKDKNSDVRLAAVSQLAASEAPAAVDGLIAALHDSNIIVVLEAIDALTSKNDARIPGELSALLTHKSQDVRDAAADAIDILQEE